MNSIDQELKCIVETNEGPVCGYIDKYEGRTIYRFNKIPYGRPPIGPLRFLPPLPALPWKEILDCTQECPLPATIDYFTEECQGSEDCLYIEVVTPNIKPTKPLPVMFWIGTYGFTFICDNYYEASTLIEEGVVFVRCVFRLGPFGFLAINDIVAPGNCGLKDIVLALKWVQKNISHFGGDPNNVTIFGSSSGGTAVHLMMLSPMASGLFHKCIIQSASALSNWGLDKNPTQATLQLAKIMNINRTDTADIVEALRSFSVDDILKAFLQLLNTLKHNDVSMLDCLFKPCIEQDFEGQPAFLTKSPFIILKSGKYNKVPFIIGSNSGEAAVLQLMKEDFYTDFEKYNQNLHWLVPKFLNVEERISRQIGQQILKFYLDGDESLTKDTRTAYVELISDFQYLYYIHKTVQLHSMFAPQCPIYYYILHYSGEWYCPEDMKIFNTNGHGAEVNFIFGLKEPGVPGILKGSRNSVKTRKRVVRMWTNFAKYGNPTPSDDPLLNIKWDVVESPDKLNYLSIGTDLTKGMNPFQDRMQFWEELHKEYTFLRTLVYFNDMGVMW